MIYYNVKIFLKVVVDMKNKAVILGCNYYVGLSIIRCLGRNGIHTVAVDYSEEKATEILSQEKVTATADLKAGKAEATAWGCDLTHGYIDINADYRS